MVDTALDGYLGKKNRMKRAMQIIDKDYNDKCTNLKDKQHVQLSNIQSKRSKGVESVFKTTKQLLFDNRNKGISIEKQLRRKSPLIFK